MSLLTASHHARRQATGRLISALAGVLAIGAMCGTAAARADVAPQQWQPTSADLVRTVRSCPMEVSAPSQPVCWSMTEDTSAWMAQPAGSPYAWGQCTYYAGVMRPDIWNDRAPRSADSLPNDWDAWTWVEHAQAEGLSVDSSPQPGDVMVYSRAAVGNDTGHVAIVDSVQGTDSSTGDEELTISEMNVEGLDDASQGQGDTSVVLVPKSQLAPGMIQFIHRPAAGYTPPSWPAGSDDGSSGDSVTAGNPSLALSVNADHVQTVSRSTAPVQAVITALPSGKTVKTMSFQANRIVPLDLPGGNYKVCISQSATGPWTAVGACATASWQSGTTTPAATTATATATAASTRTVVHLARLRRTARGLAFSLQLRVGASRSFTTRVQVTISPSVRTGARASRPARIYRTTLHLRPGRATITLPAAVRRAARHRKLRVTLSVQGPHGALAHLLATIR